MKASQPFLKMTIKLLILLILFVCMFLISALLYSAKYWPDVYNYINANITIKRIPTISELDIQIIEVNVDYTTETYSTTDADYFELTTIEDFNIDEFMKDELEIKTRVKRNIVIEEMKDYKELPSRGIFVDYIFLEEPIEINSEENKENDNDILKTVVTGMIIDDTSTIRNAINNKDSEQLERSMKLKSFNGDINIKSRLLEHTTTIEGYLVGDERYREVNKGSVIDITTEINEHDVVEQFKLVDFVDVSNLSTRSPEDVEMFSDNPNGASESMVDPICHGNSTCEEFTKAVFPWVVAIFIKNNNENSQFEYFCDGVLLSEKVILTGGRCMMQSNKTMEPHNVLVFLGKGNLQYMGGTEKLYRIKEIILHQNLSVDEDGNISNDLALLTLETSADLGDAIQSACIHTNETGELEEAGTTAWGPSGHLQPIFYEKSKSDICYDKNEDIFCATYGNNVPLCPSYGGIFATKRLTTWCLQGIFYGDPAQRGLCFNKNVLYTSLNNYFSWIDEIVDINKNVL